MGAIDVWAQITTERMARQPWLQTLRRWTGQPQDEYLAASVESTLRAMDEASVDIALLSAWYGPEGDLISNEEVSRQIAAAPARFRGLASADLRHPAAAVREIRRWVDGKTFVGCASSRGFGICRRTIGVTTRSTPPAWRPACHSAPRSATPDRSSARRPGGSFRISRTCCSIFRSSSSSVAMSAFPGSTNW